VLVLGPELSPAWFAERLNGWFCGLYSSTQESVASEEVPAGSEQFQFDAGLFNISLINIIPGVAGGEPGEPGRCAGTRGAHG